MPPHSGYPVPVGWVRRTMVVTSLRVPRTRGLGEKKDGCHLSISKTNILKKNILLLFCDLVKMSKFSNLASAESFNISHIYKLIVLRLWNVCIYFGVQKSKQKTNKQKTKTKTKKTNKQTNKTKQKTKKTKKKKTKKKKGKNFVTNSLSEEGVTALCQAFFFFFFMSEHI